MKEGTADSGRFVHVWLTLSSGLELASITTKGDDGIGCGYSLT